MSSARTHQLMVTFFRQCSALLLATVIVSAGIAQPVLAAPGDYTWEVANPADEMVPNTMN